MRRTVLIPLLVAVSGFATIAALPGAEVFAKQPPQESAAALRAQGPAGLQTLLTRYGAEIAAHRADPQKAAPGWRTIEQTLDAVAGQRDAWAAKLYWYTDLNAAKAAAKAQNKPILSLRLLGKLTDEYSCANSRFFRTALYANEGVSKTLRENFILHWQSERPVPVLTIDMGDGRVVKRTLTGNSIHYLLDPEGRPLDALPGLYGPGAFARWLGSAGQLAANWQAQPQGAREAWLQNYHREQITKLAEAYVSPNPGARGNRERLAKELLETPLPVAISPPLQNRMAISAIAPSAMTAGRLAVSKMFVEAPILNVSALYSAQPARQVGDEGLWTAMAKTFASDATLDANSLALMRTKTAQPIIAASELPAGSAAQPALRLANGGQASFLVRPASDEPLDVVTSFQTTLALDSVRNEYRMHAPLHAWFVKGTAPANLEALNVRVYSELFLTPKDDPWLGLAPAGLYAALPGDGLGTK